MGGSSKSAQKSQQFTAADDGINIGDAGTVATGSGVSVSGEKGTVNQNSGDGILMSGLFNRVRITDEGATRAALEAMAAANETTAELIESLMASNESIASGATSAANNAITEQTAQLTDVLAKQAELAKQVQSGGETERDKSILYAVGMALLAALAITFLFRKKAA